MALGHPGEETLFASLGRRYSVHSTRLAAKESPDCRRRSGRFHAAFRPAGSPLRHLSTKELRQIAPQATLLIHGENAVPKDLADFCKEPYSLGFTFDEGELLRLSLRELQLIETFCDSLLTALNISLMERAKPSLRDEAAKRFESHKK
jgi:hypothetical protein